MNQPDDNLQNYIWRIRLSRVNKKKSNPDMYGARWGTRSSQHRHPAVSSWLKEKA